MIFKPTEASIEVGHRLLRLLGKCSIEHIVKWLRRLTLDTAHLKIIWPNLSPEFWLRDNDLIQKYCPKAIRQIFVLRIKVLSLKWQTR